MNRPSWAGCGWDLASLYSVSKPWPSLSPSAPKLLPLWADSGVQSYLEERSPRHPIPHPHHPYSGQFTILCRWPNLLETMCRWVGCCHFFAAAGGALQRAALASLYPGAPALGQNTAAGGPAAPRPHPAYFSPQTCTQMSTSAQEEGASWEMACLWVCKVDKGCYNRCPVACYTIRVSNKQRDSHSYKAPPYPSKLAYCFDANCQ